MNVGTKDFDDIPNTETIGYWYVMLSDESVESLDDSAVCTERFLLLLVSSYRRAKFSAFGSSNYS